MFKFMLPENLVHWASGVKSLTTGLKSMSGWASSMRAICAWQLARSCSCAAVTAAWRNGQGGGVQVLLSDYDDAHRQHRDFHYCVVDAEVT
jgi:hypothetical protein